MLHRAAELGTVEELNDAFVVKDASGQKLGYLGEDRRRSNAIYTLRWRSKDTEEAKG